MSIETLLADAAAAVALLGWAMLKLTRCSGCRAPFSAVEALPRTFLADWSCGGCRRAAEAPTAAPVVVRRPVDDALVRRHEEILAGWSTLVGS